MINEASELAQACAAIADDKKAIDPVILDIGELTSVADYFFICHADNIRHMHAIADAIVRKLRDSGVKPLGVEGEKSNSAWILIDYGMVVAHVFLNESRQFYGLEHLWSDAERVEIASAGG